MLADVIMCWNWKNVKWKSGASFFLLNIIYCYKAILGHARDYTTFKKNECNLTLLQINGIMIYTYNKL